MIKVILIFIIAFIVAGFVYSNLQTNVTVDLVFGEVGDVPLTLLMGICVVLGAIAMIPLIIRQSVKGRSKRKQLTKEYQKELQSIPQSESMPEIFDDTKP